MVKVCVYHSRARAGHGRLHAWVEGRGTALMEGVASQVKESC